MAKAPTIVAFRQTEAILAALKGRLLNGLITDEAVAEAILQIA